MKKIVAGRSAIRLQDTPKGKSAFGSINEDAFGMTDHSIIVADGMGGGGKTVPRENLEGLLTKNISDDARYIATNMLSRSENISVSNMVAWGLVDYISHFAPDSAQSAQAYIERVRSAVKELVPEEMNLANIGSTLQYVNDANATVTSVGDSLAFTVYKDSIQFHNLDGFDSVSMYYLKKETGFDPYNAHDWDRLKEHHLSNMVTNAVLLATEANDYTVHHGQIDIDNSQKSVTFVMSDGVAPDFLNPIEVYNIAQQLFDGEVTQDRLDSLLKQIVNKVHVRTGEGWDITKQELSQWQTTVQELKDKGDVVGANKMWQNKPAYRKSDDATIVAMYREPSKKDLIDQLFDDSADITGQRDVHGESVDGYLGGIVQTPNGPKDTRDLDEEITDPNVTKVNVEEDLSQFDQWEQDFLRSDVSKKAMADAVARAEQEHAKKVAAQEKRWQESYLNRAMTAYTGMFDKIEEWVDDKLLKIGDMIGEWHRVPEEIDYTEFLEDEGKIVIEVTDVEVTEDMYVGQNEEFVMPEPSIMADIELTEDMEVNPSEEGVSHVRIPGTLDSIIDTMSGMYETGKQHVTGAASRASEWYNTTRNEANEWYVAKSIELGDRYEAWSADRAARSEEKAQQRAQKMQEKEVHRQQKIEADKVAYEKAAEQSRARAEEIKREREIRKHMDSHRARARSQYWATQRDVMTQRAGYMIDRATSPGMRNLAAGLATAAVLSTAGIMAYENRDAITQYFSGPTLQERVDDVISTNNCAELQGMYDELKTTQGSYEMLKDVKRSMRNCENE